MKQFLSTALLGVLFAGSAIAADMPLKAPPPPAPFTARWTGTYLGLNGGYGWGRTNQTDTGGTTTGDYNQTGGVFGFTYGGNWQVNQWVLGFESDIDWANINGTVLTPLCVGGSCFTNVKAISTERMRAGVDLNGWLLFVTGGAAFAQVSAGQDSCPPGVCGRKWRAGWTAGGGVEYKFAPKWSAKLEYLHFDLGTQTMYTPAIPVNVSERGDMVRIGINYFVNPFGWLP